jgi:hypothetical protein
MVGMSGEEWNGKARKPEAAARGEMFDYKTLIAWSEVRRLGVRGVVRETNRSEVGHYARLSG